MKSTFLLVAFLIRFSAPIQAQFVELFSIEQDCDFIEFDNLFSVYAVKGAEILKYNPDGSVAFQFSDRQMGKVGGLDVTFPLRPLVLYPELNYVILLDNTLSNNRGRINLTGNSIGLMTTGCSSVQNHFWFYDAMDFALIRMNENFDRVSTTGNLSQVLRTELNPNFLTEFANRVYLNDPNIGILVFDIFGTYIKTIPIKGLDEFQVTETSIVYFANDRLYFYHIRDFSESELKLPEVCEEAYVFENRIAARCGKKITVWEVIRP